MSVSKLLSKTADYNVWANNALVSWLETKPTADLSEEVASSWNSLLKTLNHIWAVEEFWMGVIAERPMSTNPRYMASEFNAEEILPGLIAQSKEIQAFVSSLHEEQLNKVIRLDLPWVKGEAPVFELIHHLFNHSTYHRGQLTSIGRRLGYTDAPMTDFNFYNMVVLAPVA